MPYKLIADRRASNRRYYRRHAAKEIRRIREREKANFDAVQTLKVGRGCADCPERHPAVLEFAHRNRSGKEFDVATAVAQGWGFDRILAEIAKCDVVCANCHRKRHWIDGKLLFV